MLKIQTNVIQFIAYKYGIIIIYVYMVYGTWPNTNTWKWKILLNVIEK